MGGGVSRDGGCAGEVADPESVTDLTQQQTMKRKCIAYMENYPFRCLNYKAVGPRFNGSSTQWRP